MPELSALITRHTTSDIGASEPHLAWTDFFRVEHTRFTGDRDLLQTLKFTLSRPSREADLVRWFAFCVGAWLEPALRPALTGPGDERLQRVCAALLADDDALRSIRRYATSESLWIPDREDLEGAPRVSKETARHRLAAALFHVTRVPS